MAWNGSSIVKGGPGSLTNISSVSNNPGHSGLISSDSPFISAQNGPRMGSLADRKPKLEGFCFKLFKRNHSKEVDSWINVSRVSKDPGHSGLISSDRPFFSVQNVPRMGSLADRKPKLEGFCLKLFKPNHSKEPLYFSFKTFHQWFLWQF